MGWFWEDLLSHWAAELCIFGGGIVLALLKKYKAAWAPIAAYGFGGATCIAVILYALIGTALFSKPPVNPSNIEQHVKEWTTNLGMGFQPLKADGTDFVYKIFLSNGNSLNVGKNSKDKSGYLQFASTVIVSPDDRTALAKLPADQAVAVEEELVQSLANSKVGFNVSAPDRVHTESILLTQSVPIAGLTEAIYAEQINALDSDMLLVTSSFALAVQKRTLKADMPLAKK